MQHAGQLVRHANRLTSTLVSAAPLQQMVGCLFCARALTSNHKRYCSAECAGAGYAARAAEWSGRPKTTHPLARGEAVEVFWPTHECPSGPGVWWPGVVRDAAKRWPRQNSHIRIWMLPSATHHGWTENVQVESRRRLLQNPLLLRGLNHKWPGLSRCRYCLGGRELEVCTSTSCPYQQQYAVCGACRQLSPGCDGCRLQRRTDAAVVRATAELKFLLEPTAPPGLKRVRRLRCGWTLYTARRRVTRVEANKFKGMWDEGLCYLPVPLNAVVVDDETGELVVARVEWQMGVPLQTLQREIEGNPQPSQACGAKGGPVDVRRFLTEPHPIPALDGVSTLASLRLATPKSPKANFWTLAGTYISCQTEQPTSWSQWGNTVDAVFSQSDETPALKWVLEVANECRAAVLEAAGAQQRPPGRELRGCGIVQDPTACHRDCESKEEMCDDCVSVLWAQKTERAHLIPEWGLRVVAGKEVAVLERPKKNVHGTVPCPAGERWGRVAIACFEQWKGGANKRPKTE